MRKEYFWVIGGGLMQVPIIEKLKLKGLHSLVTDANPKAVCASLSDLFFEIDIFDIESHITLADELTRQGIIIKGVLAAGIDAPITMSAIGEHLDLNVVPRSISEIVNNKALFREWMSKNEEETPLFREFFKTEYNEFQKYKKVIGYPLIIKNVNSSASRGTKIFNKEDLSEEARVFMEAIEVSRSNSCLVESVWTGSEHTVETLWDYSGNVQNIFITDRIFDYSSGFPLEIGLQNPTSLNFNQQKQCFEVANRIAKKLGITIGAAKFDIIFTENGPRVIEMTTRLSGGFDCQYLVPAATGQDVLGAAIDTNLGRSISEGQLEKKYQKFAVSGSVWPQPGVVQKIVGLEPAKAVSGVNHIFMRVKEGDLITDYSNCADRAVIIIASGVTLQAAQKALDTAKNILVIETTE
jgi:biotin carboxylase